jgi:hypothetical protein
MARKTPFEREIREMMERMYPFVYRIPDVMGQRFTSQKPADFVACDQDGNFIIVEAKSTRQAVFNFSAIPNHQRDALALIADAGGQAFLALNMREKHGAGKAWWISWGFWVSWEQLWLKKSIRTQEAEKALRIFELVRITGGWEINRQLRLRRHGAKLKIPELLMEPSGNQARDCLLGLKE